MTPHELERHTWRLMAAADAFTRLTTGTPTRADLLFFCVTFPQLETQIKAVVVKRVGAAVMLQWLDERPDVDENLVAAHDIPDDFGIPETEVELELNRVIEIAQSWKIGGAKQTIRNRATVRFKRYDGESDCKLGRRFSLPRDEAIAFLQDLKRTTKQTVPD